MPLLLIYVLYIVYRDLILLYPAPGKLGENKQNSLPRRGYMMLVGNLDTVCDFVQLT